MALRTPKLSIALPVLLAACLVLSLVAGAVYFTSYLKGQIFEERSTQLVEITSQVRANLDNALNSQWSFLTAAVNGLEDVAVTDRASVETALGQVEDLLGTADNHSILVLVDDQGAYCDAAGRQGLWADFSSSVGGQDRAAFISHSDQYQGSYWVFAQALPTPLETSDGSVFTYAVLLKDIQTLVQFYDSSAYGNQSETYILKSDGTRMHDDVSQGHSITAYNVLKALQDMEGSRYDDIRAAIGQDGTISSNFWRDGEEYYYCITSLSAYDTLLVFLIPAALVAPGTVGMMETVLGTLTGLAVLVLVLALLTVVAVLRQRSSAQLARQEQANARAHEKLNAELASANEQLAASRASVEQAFEIAESANQAKSSFLSSMSHDIRTPMNAIVGFSGLLAKDADDPQKVREYAKKITASSQHLLGLINDVLDISKIEAGKTTLNLTDERMTDLVEAVDAIIRPQMRERGHAFQVEVRDLTHDAVLMDRVRLNQILLNLLSNAVKYTPDGGEVRFTVQELTPFNERLARFQFTVADNGYGMSEEYLETIFHTFSREEDAVVNQIQGTGLGMTITKSLVDLMGGHIAVESAKGVGSTFTVELELQIGSEVETGAGKAGADEDVSGESALAGLRILAAEDNLFNAELLREFMDMAGATVEVCENGRAAVEAFEASAPGAYDLILMDVQMPVMNGYDATRAIRGGGHERAATIPIVAMTADAFAEDIRRALDAGMCAHVAKPIDMAVLEKTVREVLADER